jgi:hypothetical protein
MATSADELLDVLSRLPADQQRRVLGYARALAERSLPISTPPPGKPASELLKFPPTLTHEEVESMRRAIEEGCETIEPEEY